MNQMTWYGLVQETEHILHEEQRNMRTINTETHQRQTEHR